MTTTPSNLPEVATIGFHGAQLITVKQDNIEFVAMRPVVEGIGLAWQSQREKLQENKEKFSCNDIVSTGKDGKYYSMLCMPITKLNGWLFTINPNKIPNIQTREKVISYQEECFVALYDYWHKGKAERIVEPSERINRVNKINDRPVWDTIWAIALRKGMNMAELARATNISPGDLNKYKNGKNIGPTLFARFVKALEVAPESLLIGPVSAVVEDRVLFVEGEKIKLCSEEITAIRFFKLLDSKQKMQALLQVINVYKEFVPA